MKVALQRQVALSGASTPMAAGTPAFVFTVKDWGGKLGDEAHNGLYAAATGSMDTTGFDAAYEPFFRDLRRVCQALGAGQVADDIAREALLEVRQQLAELGDDDRVVLTSLRQMAVAASREWRRRWTGPRPSGSYRFDTAAFEGLKLEVYQRAAIGAMPVRQREMIALVYVAGYQPREVAEMLGDPPEYVAQTLWAARCSLADELAAYKAKARW